MMMSQCQYKTKKRERIKQNNYCVYNKSNKIPLESLLQNKEKPWAKTLRRKENERITQEKL